MGTAMNSVSAAYAAVTRGRFDELAPLLADDLDWYGLAAPDGSTPSCHGRATALERMRHGLLTVPGEITVRAFVEHDVRVMAHVVRRDADGIEQTRFVVAEVRDGEIARMRAFSGRQVAAVVELGERLVSKRFGKPSGVIQWAKGIINSLSSVNPSLRSSAKNVVSPRIRNVR